MDTSKNAREYQEKWLEERKEIEERARELDAISDALGYIAMMAEGCADRPTPEEVYGLMTMIGRAVDSVSIGLQSRL